MTFEDKLPKGDQDQHTYENSARARRVTTVDSSGKAVNFGSLVPEAYDEIDLTYVAAGNGAGEIETATYKLATVTVAILTLTYDADDKLSTVVRT